MDNQAASAIRTRRYQGNQADERRQQRLKQDLGLDEEAVEVILNLRNHVTILQARVRELESTLEIYRTEYSARVKRYWQVYHEADWKDT